MAHRVDIEAKRVEHNGNSFWVSEPSNFSCKVDLSEVKVLIFPSRRREGNFTIVFDDPREYKQNNQDDSEVTEHNTDYDDNQD